MKSIMSKVSIIMLSLAAMAFTFVLGTTSSKAVSDETSFQQCIAQVEMPPNPDSRVAGSYMKNAFAIRYIISCANQS